MSVTPFEKFVITATVGWATGYACSTIGGFISGKLYGTQTIMNNEDVLKNLPQAGLAGGVIGWVIRETYLGTI